MLSDKWRSESYLNCENNCISRVIRIILQTVRGQAFRLFKCFATPKHHWSSHKGTKRKVGGVNPCLTLIYIPRWTWLPILWHNQRGRSLRGPPLMAHPLNSRTNGFFMYLFTSLWIQLINYTCTIWQTQN